MAADIYICILQLSNSTPANENHPPERNHPDRSIHPLPLRGGGSILSHTNTRECLGPWGERTLIDHLRSLVYNSAYLLYYMHAQGNPQQYKGQGHLLPSKVTCVDCGGAQVLTTSVMGRQHGAGGTRVWYPRVKISG